MTPVSQKPTSGKPLFIQTGRNEIQCYQNEKNKDKSESG